MLRNVGLTAYGLANGRTQHAAARQLQPCKLHGDGGDKRARRLALAEPRKKKKLVPRRPSLRQARAMVRATVDLPVPAMPLSQ
jgi:hypothetical protein